MSASAGTEAATAPAPLNGRSAARLVEAVFRVRELSLLGILALLTIATTIADSNFLSSQNLRDIGLNVAIVGVLAIGQTVVVVSRNIDLSVGSVLGFVAFLTGRLFVDDAGLSIPLAFAI